MRFSDWIFGPVELLRLAVVTRFRFGGAYWKWRDDTAFGRGKPRLGELVVGVVRYGAWARRMRRGG